MRLLSDLLAIFLPENASATGTQVLALSSLRKNGELKHTPNGPVLMLDIDGVLHRTQTGTLSKLPMLEEWLRKHHNIEIVLSSSWRESWSVDELTELFSPDLQSRVLGTIPSLLDSLREDEILACVSVYRIKTWVALDDMAEEFPKTGASHLVATDYYEGLTQNSLIELDMVLKSQRA